MYGTAESTEVITARLAVFPDGFIVLTDQEGVILGYGSAEKWLYRREPGLNEDPFATHQPDGKVFCITAMAVKNSHRQQGLGTAILERLIAIARQHGCTEVILETTHAQRFYQNYGFQVLNERQQRDVSLSILGLDLKTV